jgi:hypothetical protein
VDCWIATVDWHHRNSDDRATCFGNGHGVKKYSRFASHGTSQAKTKTSQLSIMPYIYLCAICSWSCFRSLATFWTSVINPVVVHVYSISCYISSLQIDTKFRCQRQVGSGGVLNMGNIRVLISLLAAQTVTGFQDASIPKPSSGAPPFPVHDDAAILEHPALAPAIPWRAMSDPSSYTGATLVPWEELPPAWHEKEKPCGRA